MKTVQGIAIADRIGITGSHERIETVVTVEKLMQSDAKDIGGFDRDILEWNVPDEVLAALLKDRSTGRNLIWAMGDFDVKGLL